MNKTIKLSELKNIRNSKKIECLINEKPFEVEINVPTNEDYNFVAEAIDKKYNDKKILKYMIENMTNIEFDEDMDMEKLPLIESLNYLKVFSALRDLFKDMSKELINYIGFAAEINNKKNNGK